MSKFIITGGAGFIGSCLLGKLNQQGVDDVIVVDNLGVSQKWKNLVGKSYADYYHKSVFLDLIESGKLDLEDVDTVFHLGACSSTTELDAEYLASNNFRFSVSLARWCRQRSARLVYASSAATYGGGELGFCDDPMMLKQLRPLNMYGYSKQMFDEWAQRNGVLKDSVGFKFFNVYGPNEYHKGAMASMVYKAYHQILQTKEVKLFKSHRPDYRDGEQLRDFIYIKDATEALWQASQKRSVNGLLNLGTGQARSWLDLARAVFSAMDCPEKIVFVDMPPELQGAYQYFTQADAGRFNSTSLLSGFTSLEGGVHDYVKNYLSAQCPYL